MHPAFVRLQFLFLAMQDLGGEEDNENAEFFDFEDISEI